MSALITSALFTLIVWANCYVNFVYTQSASSSALHSPVSDAVSRNSSESRAKESCRPGQGQVSHTLIYDPSEMWLHQAYKSSPYNPPELVITGNGQPRAPGLLFISPNRATKDTAPLIMTDTGQLVWNGPSVNASNLRVASFEGQSILTYWSGYSGGVGNLPEHGYGKVTFLDAQYREILTVCPHFNLWTDVNSPCQADFHESFVTDRDTILVTAYNITETDLSSHGASSRAWVYDSLFFEIYPRNGSIKFQWSALEHIPVNETKMHLTNELIPFDWFHINSVVNIGDKFLVNSRHCWTTYLLSANGTVEWTLQGDTGGDFGVLPPNGQFSWQHFARPHNITNTSMVISYFNNLHNGLYNGYDDEDIPSNGLALQLTIPPNKASPPVAVDYFADRKHPINSVSQGSNTILPNGNAFLGYGSIPVMKEFGPSDPSGRDVRWTARFGFYVFGSDGFGSDGFGSDGFGFDEVSSYRAIKAEWQGFPTTSPNLVVVDDENGCPTGFVSWNGATNVEEWVVGEGPTKYNFTQVRRIRYEGFETQFTLDPDHRCVQVAAKVKGKVSVSNVECIAFDRYGYPRQSQREGPSRPTPSKKM